jgi:hypothetical protein
VANISFRIGSIELDSTHRPIGLWFAQRPADGGPTATCPSLSTNQEGSREAAMPRCPVCESDHVVISASALRPALCTRCGARWTQEDGEQRAVHRLDPSPVNISAVSIHPAPPLDVLAGRTP